MVRQSGKKRKSVPTRVSPRKAVKVNTTVQPRDSDEEAGAAVPNQPQDNHIRQTGLAETPEGPNVRDPADPKQQVPEGQAPIGPNQQALTSSEAHPPVGHKQQEPLSSEKQTRETRESNMQEKTKRERKQYSISEEHEEDVLEWLRENEFLWRKGHRQYRDTKKKQAAWKDKADSLGYTVEILLGWWKHMHSWYGKLHLKKSGQAAVKLTDREKYIVAKCGFLEGEIRHRSAAPLKPLSLVQPTDNQETPTLPRQVPSESPTTDNSSTTTVPLVPNFEDSVEDYTLLSQLEGQAAAARNKPNPNNGGSSIGRKQRSIIDSQDDSVLLEIRDTMKTSTELLSKLVDLDRASSSRKPFITYVSQTLRDLQETEYQVVKEKITTLLHNPHGASEARLVQPRSAPPQLAMTQPVHGFQQPLINQGYGFQDFAQHSQNFPVQSQVNRTPQTPLLTQLQTKQPQHTYQYTSCTSTPDLRSPADNISTVLSLTSSVVDDESPYPTGLGQFSEANLSVLNTPQLTVTSMPSTPVLGQSSTQATATVPAQYDTTQ